MADLEMAKPLDEKRLTETARNFIHKDRNWSDKEFRIDIKEISADGSHVIVWAVFLEDEIRPIPGAGKSLELHISTEDYSVIRKLAFQ